jgi:DNA-binding response OmpR family regulator
MRLHLFDHGHRPHLLIVAGNPTLAQALAGGAPVEHFETSVASSRAEALRLNGSAVFNGFVVDANLPDAHGADLVRDLRDARVNAPILFIDSLAGPLVTKTEVDATLTKPVPLDEFRRRLQELFLADDPTSDLTIPSRRKKTSFHLSTLLIPLLLGAGIALTCWLLSLS